MASLQEVAQFFSKVGQDGGTSFVDGVFFEVGSVVVRISSTCGAFDVSWKSTVQATPSALRAEIDVVSNLQSETNSQLVAGQTESQLDAGLMWRVASVVKGPYFLDTANSNPQHLLGLRIIPTRTPSSPLQLHTFPVHLPDAHAVRNTTPRDTSSSSRRLHGS